MPTKTITVQHPDAHTAPAGALEEAATEAEIPDGWTVKTYTNESGVATKYVLIWGEDEPPAEEAKPKGRVPRDSHQA